MEKSFASLLSAVDQPLIDLFNHETKVQRALREVTILQVKHHHMMTTPEQVGFLSFLLKLINAQRVIEVGVFTGYGTLAMAQALPEQGRLIACDHNKVWPLIGQIYWQQAGVADKIDLHIAPAVETLQALLDEGQAGQFDFIFVDADKIHYADYYALTYQLLGEGGVVVFDNIFWIHQQRVIKKNIPATRSVAKFLELVSCDNRFEKTLIPIADGMLLARKCA